MTIKALLFDLDDTLVWEVPAAHAARMDAAAPAQERYGIEPAALSAAVKQECRKLWYASPMHPYAKRTAISSWEGLWSPFTAADPDAARLREWAPEYRFQSWRNGLAAFDVADDALAREMAENFPEIRRTYNVLFDDALPCLEWAAAHYALALVSNGAGDLQRLKLTGAELDGWFPTVVISGEIGVRKPHPAYFETALEKVGVTAGEALVVGNSLHSDIPGAQAVGIFAVWLNRDGEHPGDVVPDAAIASLDELPAVLDTLS